MAIDKYIAGIGGGSELLSSILSGVNPVGNYTSQGFTHINDIDSLVNTGFNTKNVENKYNTLGTLSSATGAGATIGTAILPGLGTAVGAIGGALVGGITSLFGKNKMAEKTRIANFKTAANFNNQAQLLQSNELLNAKLNPMNNAAMGGNFSKLSYFNTGGSHEKNTYGGVPFSMSGGTINDAEQGETMVSNDTSNRIYSDRIILNSPVLKIAGLSDKYKGKTPAFVSKDINSKFALDKVSGKEALLPMDKIRRNALMNKLDDVFMAQELIKDNDNSNSHLADGGTVLRNTRNRIVVLDNIVNPFSKGGIHIKESKKGTFTAAATKHDMGVQAFASKVLANKENYSSAMVKKANFARNASKWHHGLGDETLKAAGFKFPDFSKKIDALPFAYNPSNNPSNSSDNKLNSFLKYSPVIGNILQTLSLATEKPEVVNYQRISTPTKPREISYKDIDSRPYTQQLEKNQRTTTGQIREATAGNRAQYLSSLLGSDLAYTSKAGELQSSIDQNNFQRRMAVLSANNANQSVFDQLRMNTENANSNIAMQEADVNARSRANLSNLRRAGLQSIFGNLGAVGSEQENINAILQAYGIDPITFKRGASTKATKVSKNTINNESLWP